MIEAAASCELPPAILAPMIQEAYFVRFVYEYDDGEWSCYGLDEHKASEEPDAGVALDVRLWAKLVLRCAKALKRAASNLPAYTAETSIEPARTVGKIWARALAPEAATRLASFARKGITS